MDVEGLEEISGLELEVVPLPSFSPLGGMSGTVTQITFSGTLPGDYIVFNEVNDCDNAHTIGTGIGSLAKTALDGQNRLSTVTAMSAARRFYVCYATRESGPNRRTKFVLLSTTFEQSNIDFALKRVVEGSGPHSVNVTNLEPHDTSSFMLAACNTTASPSADATKTQSITVGGGQTTAVVTLANNLQAGTYKLCRTPQTSLSGMYSVSGMDLTVLPKPSFEPAGTKAAAEHRGADLQRSTRTESQGHRGQHDCRGVPVHHQHADPPRLGALQHAAALRLLPPQVPEQADQAVDHEDSKDEEAYAATDQRTCEIVQP